MTLKPKYFVLVWALAACAGAHGQIRRVTTFREDARNPSWSKDARILFERAGQIVLAGTNPAADRKIASGAAPEWSPSGRFLAFASGGAIVLMDPDTRRILDSFPAGKARQIRFSRDGASLAWMDSGAASIRTGGRLMNLPMPDGLTLANVDDFSASGQELLVTAFRSPGRTEIYACMVARPACRAVTDKRAARQDFARLSPSGRKLVFTSSETAWVPDAPIDYEADLWLATVDPPGKALRMTWFNEPANPRYDPAGARVSSASWSNDGRSLLATITEAPRQDRSRLVKIEFPEPE